MLAFIGKCFVGTVVVFLTFAAIGAAFTALATLAIFQ